MSPYPRIEKPLNYCRGCSQDFASERAFDKHRVGTHEYTYSEGAAMDPPHEDGRRCLTLDELQTLRDKRGGPLFRLNARGRWELAHDADRLRERYTAPPEGAADEEAT